MKIEFEVQSQIENAGIRALLNDNENIYIITGNNNVKYRVSMLWQTRDNLPVILNSDFCEYFPNKDTKLILRDMF